MDFATGTDSYSALKETVNILQEDQIQFHLEKTSLDSQIKNATWVAQTLKKTDDNYQDEKEYQKHIIEHARQDLKENQYEDKIFETQKDIKKVEAVIKSEIRNIFAWPTETNFLIFTGKIPLPSHPNIDRKRIGTERDEIFEAAGNQQSNSEDSDDQQTKFVSHPNMQFYRNPTLLQHMNPKQNYVNHPMVKLDRSKRQSSKQIQAPVRQSIARKSKDNFDNMRTSFIISQVLKESASKWLNIQRILQSI